MNRFLGLLISLLVLLCTSVHATTDVYLSSGSATGNYIESVDSQRKLLTGVENSLSYKSLKNFSFVDLGIDLGTLNLSGDSGLHKVDFGSNYINLTAGISLSLYPSWIEYQIDLGYRYGTGKIEIQRTKCDGSVDQHTHNEFVNNIIFKYGVKFLTFDKYLLGIQREIKNTLIEKTTETLNPKIESADSLTFFFGYRFGGGGGRIIK